MKLLSKKKNVSVQSGKTQISFTAKFDNGQENVYLVRYARIPEVKILDIRYKAGQLEPIEYPTFEMDLEVDGVRRSVSWLREVKPSLQIVELLPVQFECPMVEINFGQGWQSFSTLLRNDEVFAKYDAWMR